MWRIKLSFKFKQLLQLPCVGELVKERDQRSYCVSRYIILLLHEGLTIGILACAISVITNVVFSF